MSEDEGYLREYPSPGIKHLYAREFVPITGTSRALAAVSLHLTLTPSVAQALAIRLMMCTSVHLNKEGSPEAFMLLGGSTHRLQLLVNGHDLF